MNLYLCHRVHLKSNEPVAKLSVQYGLQQLLFALFVSWWWIAPPFKLVPKWWVVWWSIKILKASSLRIRKRYGDVMIVVHLSLDSNYTFECNRSWTRCFWNCSSNWLAVVCFGLPPNPIVLLCREISDIAQGIDSPPHSSSSSATVPIYLSVIY